jgi:phage terminase small subunit
LPDTSLSLRQARFAAEYVIDLNGEKAAIRAGYSPKTAKFQASRLLTNVNLQVELSRLQAERARRTELSADWVLRRLIPLADANMADYMRADPISGDPYFDFSRLTRDQTAALQEVTVDSYVEGRGDDARKVKRVRFKLADKRAALVDIGRHLGMFTDKHEVTGKDGAPLMPAEPSKVALVLLNILSRARPEPDEER